MPSSADSASRAALSLRRSTGMNSKSRPLGSSGLRLEMPTTSQPAERKPSIAATPMSPLAPATRTLLLLLIPFLQFHHLRTSSKLSRRISGGLFERPSDVPVG